MSGSPLPLVAASSPHSGRRTGLVWAPVTDQTHDSLRDFGRRITAFPVPHERPRYRSEQREAQIGTIDAICERKRFDEFAEPVLVTTPHDKDVFP